MDAIYTYYSVADILYPKARGDGYSIEMINSVAVPYVRNITNGQKILKYPVPGQLNMVH